MEKRCLIGLFILAVILLAALGSVGKKDCKRYSPDETIVVGVLQNGDSLGIVKNGQKDQQIAKSLGGKPIIIDYDGDITVTDYATGDPLETEEMSKEEWLALYPNSQIYG